MHWAILGLLLLAFVVAVPVTIAARALGRRLGALDGAGVAGQVKATPRHVPNTGGIGIAGTILLLALLGLAMLATPLGPAIARHVPGLAEHLPGLASRVPEGLALLLCVLLLHIVGVIDDRRALPAVPKLVLMFAVALAAVLLTRTRALTLLDAYVGGPWLSVLITVLWIVAVTNAMNFIDNMDGLCGGVALIAGGALLATALIQHQWFNAAMLALVCGAVLGFLPFNFPLRKPASIFMGDGGSLVCGFLLAVLSARLTYLPVNGAPISAMNAHAVLVPVVVLAVPIYDLVSVTFLRLWQGRNPLVGDLQHLSHRLHQRGLTRRRAVVVICGLTAITAAGGVMLPALQPWQAMLVLAQTALVLVVLGIYELGLRSN